MNSSCGDATSFELSSTELKKAANEVQYCYKNMQAFNDFQPSDFTQFAGPFF